MDTVYVVLSEEEAEMLERLKLFTKSNSWTVLRATVEIVYGQRDDPEIWERFEEAVRKKQKVTRE